MNILEKADKYAEGKALSAMTKAIAHAYAEGYRDGYNDRDQEIPAAFRDKKTQYVDLGLPSGTLWSSDYERDDNGVIYLPYEKAECEKIPTKEQYNELLKYCRIVYNIDNTCCLVKAEFVGPNGNILTFKHAGRYLNNEIEDFWEVYFWLTDDAVDATSTNRTMVNMCNKSKSNGGKFGESISYGLFSGYKLPLRLVR